MLQTHNCTVETLSVMFRNGLKLRNDVATKSKLVIQILAVEFESAEDEKAQYAKWAEEYNVVPATVRNWVKTYKDVCEQTQYALPGTRSIATDIIVGTKNQQYVIAELAKLEEKAKALISGKATSPLKKDRKAKKKAKKKS